MTSRTVEKILAGLVLVFMVLSITLLIMKYTNWRPTIPSYPTTPAQSITQPTTQSTHQPEPAKPRPEQIIANYLREFPVKSEIREKAVSILREYLGKSSVILQDSFSISAGSYERVKLELHSDIIYELVVSVSGSCIGTCDIYLRLVDSDDRLVQVYTSSGLRVISGYYSYLRINFTLHPLFGEEGVYYLVLDNKYSLITSKRVYVTLRAYYPSYAFNDEYFEVFVIGHWVSKNVKYISDPYGLEYIAPPNETLRVGAGDCDDFAVLLAVLYRSIGLNATVGLIDTNGDKKAEHATALVYFNASSSEILNRVSKWASVIGVKVNVISYFNANGGTLLIIDPPMSIDSNNPWSIYHEPYKLVLIVKP